MIIAIFYHKIGSKQPNYGRHNMIDLTHDRQTYKVLTEPLENVKQYKMLVFKYKLHIYHNLLNDNQFVNI